MLEKWEQMGWFLATAFLCASIAALVLCIPIAIWFAFPATLVIPAILGATGIFFAALASSIDAYKNVKEHMK